MKKFLGIISYLASALLLFLSLMFFWGIFIIITFRNFDSEKRIFDLSHTKAPLILAIGFIIIITSIVFYRLGKYLRK